MGRRAAAAARTALDLLTDADDLLRAGGGYGPRPVPTGFTPLDHHLGGGLRPGDLTLLCGRPGLGKTLMALQVARNVAVSGGQVTCVSYEHGEQQLLERLLAMEIGLLAGTEGIALQEVRGALLQDGRAVPLRERHPHPVWVQAVRAVQEYGPRLHLVCGSGRTDGLARLEALAHPGQLLVLDYLQKVAVPDGAGSEEQRTACVVEELKDLALERQVAVLAVVAVDRQAFEGRTRLHHLRGSTSLAYEADAVLVLNDKSSIVARHHLMYGATGTERFHDYVVCSIEKNRSGSQAVDLEFRKHFGQARFDPAGGLVAETLVDDRVHVDL